MWGQVIINIVIKITGRIIPTRVGTSLITVCFGNPDRDHPHACGDKLQSINQENRELGSSPRVWGQEMENMEDMNRLGIIPTRVGTSISFTFYNATDEDHPHACGDKSSMTAHIITL